LDNFLDIFELSLNKTGERLCGDRVKVFKGEHRTIVVLSDGLGSGVKANILATLTTEIILTMLKAEARLEEVIQTVIQTLPICQVRKIAYATFTVIEIDNLTGDFKVINFDNPPVFYLRGGWLSDLKKRTENILGKEICIAAGHLQRGDFLGVISDGVIHAGMGITRNFGWSWEEVARHIQDVFRWNPHSARSIVQRVIAEAHSLYQGDVGDDTTFAGVFVRERNALMIFTGPPLNMADDEIYVSRLMAFSGRKVVCGGTTGNIVADYLGERIETDVNTLQEDVPPIGYLSRIDLLTEGILTMIKTLEYLKETRGNIQRLPRKPRNGAVMLAKEMLQADYIEFLVGQKINEFYQNPFLPQNLSIRINLIRELSEFLRSLKKEVKVDFC